MIEWEYGVRDVETGDVWAPIKSSILMREDFPERIEIVRRRVGSDDEWEPIP